MVGSVEQNREVDRATLERQFRSGADWFFWIAGLSLVNLIVSMTGSDYGFVVGLGVSQAIGYIIAEFGTAAQAVGLIIGLMGPAFFALFGVWARKGHNWAFITGMILYALDGLLLLALSEYVGAGFHAFALYCIFTGFRANRKLRRLPAETAETPAA